MNQDFSSTELRCLHEPNKISQGSTPYPVGIWMPFSRYLQIPESFDALLNTCFSDFPVSTAFSVLVKYSSHLYFPHWRLQVELSLSFFPSWWNSSKAYMEIYQYKFSVKSKCWPSLFLNVLFLLLQHLLSSQHYFFLVAPGTMWNFISWI